MVFKNYEMDICQERKPLHGEIYANWYEDEANCQKNIYDDEAKAFYLLIFKRRKWNVWDVHLCNGWSPILEMAKLLDPLGEYLKC